MAKPVTQRRLPPQPTIGAVGSQAPPVRAARPVPVASPMQARPAAQRVPQPTHPALFPGQQARFATQTAKGPSYAQDFLSSRSPETRAALLAGQKPVAPVSAIEGRRGKRPPRAVSPPTVPPVPPPVPPPIPRDTGGLVQKEVPLGKLPKVWGDPPQGPPPPPPPPPGVVWGDSLKDMGGPPPPPPPPPLWGDSLKDMGGRPPTPPPPPISTAPMDGLISAGAVAPTAGVPSLGMGLPEEAALWGQAQPMGVLGAQSLAGPSYRGMGLGQRLYPSLESALIGLMASKGRLF